MATRFGILSTFPPTQCGLATFSSALATHLIEAGADVSVVRLVDSRQPPVPLVSHQLVTGAPDEARAAAAALNACDVALVQHEYGIYGGPDGVDVLDVLARVRVPVITVLHTVLARPTPHQHEVLARVVAASSVTVTMTEAGRQELIAGWGVDPESVTVIAHGARDNQAGAGSDGRLHPAPVVLTWGLLGEGKGIEWALEALAGLTDLRPRPTYRIVGQTHPKVLEHSGEAYRHRLERLVDRLDLGALVQLDDRYLDVPTLQRIVAAADVVLLPYDSPDQVTSGVLTEAVVAGKPVVSTAFPHAVELLSGGAGLLVPRRGPAAIRTALRRVLTEPGLAAAMGAASRGLAPGLLWSAVAGQYIDLGAGLLRARTLSAA